MADQPKNFRKIKLSHAEDFYVRKVLKETRLEEVMVRSPICVFVDDLFHVVIQKMNEHRIRHIPVVDRTGVLEGIITQRDLFKNNPPHKAEDGSWYYDTAEADNLILRHVMTPKPYTLKPEDTLDKAVLAMAQFKYGCIPIVDDKGKVCGIITQMDIIFIAANILVEG